MPKTQIGIREDFRRDGLCMTFLADERIIYYLAKAFPTSIINIGYPAICPKEEEMCQRITDALALLNIESATVGHALPSHLKRMAKIANRQKNTSANFWIPFSDYMISQTMRLSEEALLKHTIWLTNYWKDLSNRPLDIALVDCTAKGESLSKRLRLFYEELTKGGVRSVIVCDTRGIATSRRLTDLLVQFRDMGAEIEYHPHNDNGAALECIRAAVLLGVKRIGTSALGFSERGTMVDPRKLVAEYHLPYDPEIFKIFEKEYYEIIKKLEEPQEVFTENTIVTGTQYRLRGKDPSLIPKFGITSDRHILAKVLGKKAINERILEEIKDDLFKERKRVFTPEELKRKFEDYKHG